MSRALIVTADDFGLSSALNRAVARAHRDGILRFASLMVDGQAAQEAVALARTMPELGVGLHLDLCRSQPELWGLRYFFLPGPRRRVVPEIRRQIEAALGLGIKPTHADGHFNIHVHPVIFPALARACREYGIPRVRLPAGESAVCGASFTALVFGTLGALLRPSAEGLVVPERCFGLLRSGLMKEDYVLRCLDGLEEGLTELYFHPSDEPASAVTDRPTPTHHTVSELETLLSPRVRAKLEALRIALHTARTQPPPTPAPGCAG